MMFAADFVPYPGLYRHRDLGFIAMEEAITEHVYANRDMYGQVCALKLRCSFLNKRVRQLDRRLAKRRNHE